MTVMDAWDAEAIRTLLGDVPPASDSLVKSLAESFRNRIDHQHPKHEDLYCLNQVAWSGERMGYLIRRLLDAEAERNCYASAVQFALAADGWTTPDELWQGLRAIIATRPNREG